MSHGLPAFGRLLYNANDLAQMIATGIPSTSPRSGHPLVDAGLSAGRPVEVGNDQRGAGNRSRCSRFDSPSAVLRQFREGGADRMPFSSAALPEYLGMAVASSGRVAAGGAMVGGACAESVVEASRVPGGILGMVAPNSLEVVEAAGNSGRGAHGSGGEALRSTRSDAGDSGGEATLAGEQACMPTPRGGEEFAPARPDAPARRAYTRGSRARVGACIGGGTIKHALKQYELGKFASSARSSRLSIARWWPSRAQTIGFSPYPVCVGKLKVAGALLKFGGYRAAATYLYAIKRTHIREYGEWTPAMEIELKDGIRSCTRGIGPPAQCTALDLGAVAALPVASIGESGGAGEPRFVKDAVLVACWWALREIEASTLRVRQVLWCQGPGRCGQSCGLLLPVSKADHMALGKKRWHGCACPAPGCPVACMVRIVEAARGSYKGDSEAWLDSPLLPTGTGGFPTKAGMVAAFCQVAQVVGHVGRITGHTGRVTGAQALAATGMELWRVQLFCRWGSDVVLRYVRDAALATSVAFSTQVVKSWQGQWTLDELRLAAQAKLGNQGVKHEQIQRVALNEALEAFTEQELDAAAVIETAGQDMQEMVAPASGKLILNIKSDCVHAAILEHVTACGWKWQAYAAVEVTSCSQEARCKICDNICPEVFA